MFWGKTVQNSIHNPVSRLRLVPQSNLLELGVIILCSNEKREEKDVLIETRFKVTNEHTMAALINICFIKVL